MFSRLLLVTSEMLNGEKASHLSDSYRFQYEAVPVFHHELP
jgi:hypothetical protein